MSLERPNQSGSDQLHQRLTKVFRELFDQPKLEIQDSYTAADIDGWDSLMQVNLIVAIEEEFDVRFTTNEIASFLCIGDVRKLVVAKQSAVKAA
jgi:acyl carrier protein